MISGKARGANMQEPQEALEPQPEYRKYSKYIL